MFVSVTLVGHVGNDPELRYTPNGKAVTSFRVAVNRKFGQTDETLWVKVTAWDKLAEICGEYVKKGQLVLVEADWMKVEAYANREGKPAASVEVTARVVKFLSRPNGQGQADAGDSRQPVEEYPF
jgi:single-strand DNA-binding protein